MELSFRGRTDLLDNFHHRNTLPEPLQNKGEMHTFSPSPKSHQSTQRHLLGTIDAMDAMEEMEEIDAIDAIDAPEFTSRRLTSTD